MQALVTFRRQWRWALVAVAALTLSVILARDNESAVQAGVRAIGEGPAHASAGPPPSSPDLNIAVFPSITVKDGCDTLFNDKGCLIHPGSKFTVLVFLDSIAGLPDTDLDTIAGYPSFLIALHYSPNLTRQDRPGECNPWPDKDGINSSELDLGTPGDNRHYRLVCVGGGPGFESVYTGLIAEIDFVCPPFKSTESITIVHGRETMIPFDTHLISDLPSVVPELGAAETIVINCDNDFVWDIDESGQVSITDVFQVVQHFGEVKPTP